MGGALTFFAVGCPVCNKLVVLALGFSGALTYFAPLQPALGIAALAYAVAVIGFMMRTPEARRGGMPPKAEVAAGLPVLLLAPAWLVALGISL